MKKKEILLPSKKYFKADEEDLSLNVKLENSETLMREGERNIILDLPTQCFKLISSGASPTYQLASIVSNYAYNGVLISECLGIIFSSK